MIGLAYVFEVSLVKPDWLAVGNGVVLPRLNGASLLIAMGMLGATVMPHNLYLHSGVVLSRRQTEPRANDRARRAALIDSVIALNLAWLVNSAMVIMAAGTFFLNGLDVNSIEAAHETLAPLLGPGAAVAFAVALLAAGLSSSTTATLAGQMIIEGFLNIKFGLLLRRLITVIPALIVIGMGLDAYWILILSQVALSIQLPFAIIPLVWLTSRREIMGAQVNRPLTTVLAALAGLFVIVLNVVLLSRLAIGAAG